MKKMLFFALAAVTLFGCSEESDCDISPDNSDGQISISAAIANLRPVAKTTITGSTAAWKDGDALGLFCAQTGVAPAANVQFSVTGVASTPVWSTTTPIYWADAATMHKFLAYAPYASGNTAATAVKLPALGTGTQNGLGVINPAQDFLISNNLWATGINRSAAPVGLVFTHALSLVQFQVTIDASIAASTTLTSFVLAGGGSDKIYTTDNTSTIALSNGAITPGATSNTITVTPATAPVLSATAVTAYVLILPGTFTAPTLQINLSEAGTTPLVIPAASLVTTTFAAGSKYSYTVNISRTAITISNPTITDWTAVSGGSINAGL